VGMPMSPMMITGMWLIVAGMVLATWGLLPPRHHIRPSLSSYHVRAIDDATLTGAHWGLLFVLGVALVIDVMKPATLGFVLPGMTAEDKIPAARSACVAVCW